MKRKVWHYKVQKITLKVTVRARHLNWRLQQLSPVRYLSKNYREYGSMGMGERQRHRAAVLDTCANKLCVSPLQNCTSLVSCIQKLHA